MLKPSLPDEFPKIIPQVDSSIFEGEGVLTQELGREVQVKFTIIPLRERDSVTMKMVESSIIIFQDTVQVILTSFLFSEITFKLFIFFLELKIKASYLFLQLIIGILESLS
jgi:hypothetical protein